MKLNEFERKLLKNFNKINRPQIKKILTNIIEKKNVLHEIITSVPVGIILLDKENKVVFLNDHGEKYLKNTKMHLNKKLLDLIKNHELKTLLSLELASLEKNKKNSFKEINLFEFVSRDLGIWIYKTEEKTSGEETPPPRKVIFITDLTNWKNQALEERQKESINSLNTLTAGIAHEIKNPLGALDLHLQLVNRFVNKHSIENKSELQENLSIIQEEIKRLDSIINDFLYSFRPIAAIKKPCYLEDIVEETVALLEIEMKEKNINLQKKFSPVKKLFLFDKNQIKQLIINLIKNSLAAILERQDLERGVIKIFTQNRKDKLVLIIQDNGIGIPKNQIVDIFKPFHTTKKMGTGLGLSIVSRIVREHNGEIILNSNYKKGTEIIIEFNKNIPYLAYSD